MIVLTIYICISFNAHTLATTTEVPFRSTSSHLNLWNGTSTLANVFRTSIIYSDKNNISTSPAIYHKECYESETLEHFLVITSVQLLPNENSSSTDFKSDLEIKLTSIYKEAYVLRNLSFLNISAIVYNITQRTEDGQSEADVLYYLVEHKQRNHSCVSASVTKSLMDFILKTKGLQYLALKLGRIVVVPITSFLVEPIKQPAEERAGLVAGSLAGFMVGFLLITWLVLYCYFRCQMARKIYCNKSVMCRMDEQPMYEGDRASKAEDRQNEEAEGGPRDEQTLGQPKIDGTIKKEKKKSKKLLKQKQSSGKTLSPVEDSHARGLGDSNQFPSGPDNEVGATQSEIESTPPTLPPDILPTNVPPPTSTYQPLSPLFHLLGRPLAIWNPHRAADESRRIMEEHKKEQMTYSNANATHPVRSASAQPIGKGVTAEGPSENNYPHLGPISRADMTSKLNLINLLRKRGMLDESYSSIVLDSRVYL